MRKTPSRRRWVQTVTTISTAPPPGTFTKPAREIADIMARPEVSPKGLGSGIRMIQYFINRAGTQLTPDRRRQLERAKHILQRRLAERGSRNERAPRRS
jgi:hypothetical protein